MKKTLFIAYLLVFTFKAQGQFSIGADILGVNLSKIRQNEIGLTADSTLSKSRLAYALNAQAVAGYRWNSWEFSLGLGYQKYSWKQKFKSPAAEVAALLGPTPPFDSTLYLGNVAYKSQMYTLPLGVKYLLKYDSSSRFNVFLSFQIIPAIAFDRVAKSEFFHENVLGADAATGLTAATDAYFGSQVNTVYLEGKTELGVRFWNKKQTFSVDISMGYLRGGSTLHKQMQAGSGYVCRLGCRYFFNSKVAEKLLP